MKIKQSITHDQFTAIEMAQLSTKSRRLKQKKMIINMAGVLNLMGYLLILLMGINLIPYLILTIAIFLVGNFWIPSRRKNQILKLGNAMNGKKQSYTLSDSGIQIMMDGQSENYDWKECSDVVVNEKRILIVIKKQLVFLNRKELNRAQEDWIFKH